MNISGNATLTSNASGRPAITNLENSTVTINGGTILATNDVAINTSGILNIGGSANITSVTSSTIYTAAGTITITGGTLSTQDANSYLIYNYNNQATVTVNGETITGHIKEI